MDKAAKEIELKLKGFKICEIISGDNDVRAYNRKDFYKVCIFIGSHNIHYSDRSYQNTGPILFFGNPNIPYSWEMTSPEYYGIACLFTEEFLKSSDRSESLQQSPLFKIGGTPILELDNEQEKEIMALFQKIQVEQFSDYKFKDELIRNYIQLIIHQALKLQPSETITFSKKSSERITSVFLELLERQFPIENPEQYLRLKQPKDYAKRLSVHINHLNRSVKQVTGKPTSVHITERIVTEAKALLQYTDWDVAEIATALGFEYPTYFNNYFKRVTGMTPSSFR